MATDNIVLEHLRAIRADLADLKGGQQEIVQQIVNLRLREHVQDSEITGFAQQIARMQVDIDRIKQRLDLVGE